MESAIARPYCGYYPRIAQKAAALVQSVATNHGFSDGNKRTALILLNLFLFKSGYDLVAARGERLDEAVETVILGAVTHRLSFDDLVAWFSQQLAKQN